MTPQLALAATAATVARDLARVDEFELVLLPGTRFLPSPTFDQWGRLYRVPKPDDWPARWVAFRIERNRRRALAVLDVDGQPVEGRSAA